MSLFLPIIIKFKFKQSNNTNRLHICRYHFRVNIKPLIQYIKKAFAATNPVSTSFSKDILVFLIRLKLFTTGYKPMWLKMSVLNIFFRNLDAIGSDLIL